MEAVYGAKPPLSFMFSLVQFEKQLKKSIPCFWLQLSKKQEVMGKKKREVSKLSL